MGCTNPDTEMLINPNTRSRKRTEAFAALQFQEADKYSMVDGAKDPIYSLVRDGGVRWNSAYTMIERACVLMRTIDAYCQDSDAEAIKDDTLTHDDWGDLKKIKEILAPLYKFTKDLEGCVEEEHLSRISDARVTVAGGD